MPDSSHSSIIRTFGGSQYGVMHKFDIIEGRGWDIVVEAAKKIFNYEKQVFGQEMVCMKAITGDTGRVITIGFFESQQAHDEYAQNEKEDPRFRELFEAAKIPDSVLRLPPETDFFEVIEYDKPLNNV